MCLSWLHGKCSHAQKLARQHENHDLSQWGVAALCECNCCSFPSLPLTSLELQRCLGFGTTFLAFICSVSLVCTVCSFISFYILSSNVQPCVFGKFAWRPQKWWLQVANATGVGALWKKLAIQASSVGAIDSIDVRMWRWWRYKV